MTGGLVVRGDGGTFLRLQLAAVEDRLSERCAQDGEAGDAADQGRHGHRAPGARKRDLRVEVRRGHADPGAGLVEQRFRRLDVGTLPGKLGRHGERQLGRQVKVGERDFRKLRVAGKLAEIDGETVARLFELRLQGRHRSADARQLAAVLDDVDVGHAAELLEVLDDLELAGCQRDHRLGRGDLLLERCQLNRRRHHVSGKQELTGDQLVALIVDGRLQPFELAPSSPEQVERVGNPDGRIGERDRKIDDGDVLPADGRAECAHPRVDLRQARGAASRFVVLLRADELRLHLRRDRAVLERLAHEGIERFAFEQAPPFGRDIAALGQRLHLPAGNVRRVGLLGQRRRRRVTAGASGRLKSGPTVHPLIAAARIGAIAARRRLITVSPRSFDSCGRRSS